MLTDRSSFGTDCHLTQPELAGLGQGHHWLLFESDSTSRLRVRNGHNRTFPITLFYIFDCLFHKMSWPCDKTLTITYFVSSWEVAVCPNDGRSLAGGCSSFVGYNSC